jgi:acetyl-CoA carboxylase biotin carboxylase subunit
MLIASRGESAVRVIQACRELGIKSVAIHSRADSNSRAVQLADESTYIGPGQAEHRLRLSIPALITAALVTGADAIHPGYGPLTENQAFADACADYKITLIGAKPGASGLQGDKARVKLLMRDAGLPVVPGTAEAVISFKEADDLAQQLGYPIILKPVAGQGGHGLTVVGGRADLEDAFNTTQDLARQLFNDRRLYLEKFIERSRHTEVQILADDYGHGVHLGERDCSVQRGYQKLIAEAPSIHLTPERRQKMCWLAVTGALAAGYSGACTLEFVLAPDGNFYFLEINARLAAEHPVTETVSGIDLVKEQIRVAAGERLRIGQEEIRLRGHAFACHIYAEDRSRGPAPGSGELIQAFIPACGPGIRVDTDIHPGWSLPSFYGPLLAKLVGWAEDRPSAFDRMTRALGEMTIRGVKTTLLFHQRLFANQAFRRGDVFNELPHESKENGSL